MKHIPQERFWLFRNPYERWASLLIAIWSACREFARPEADKIVQRVRIFRWKKHQMWFEVCRKATSNKSSNMRWHPTRSHTPTENRNFQAHSCVRRHIQGPPSVEVAVSQMKTHWQRNHYRSVRVYAVATPLCLGTQSSLTRCIVTINSHSNVAMNFIFSKYMLDIRVLLSSWYSLLLYRIVFVFSVTVNFRKNSSICYSITSVFHFFNFFNFRNFLSCRWSK